MITKPEFLNLIHGQIFPLLKKCETERLSALKKWGVLMRILSVVLMIIFIKYIGFDKENKNFLIFSIFLSFIPISIGYTKLRRFSANLKEKFLPHLYETLGLKEIKKETGIVNDNAIIPENLKYLDLDSTNPIEHKIITWINSNFFSNEIDDFCYDDCFSDKKDLLNIYEYQVSERSGKRSTTIFQGPIVEFKTDIKLNRKILVFQKLGIFSNQKIKIQKELNYKEFQITDAVFDKEFSVYAQNRIEAKSLLNKVFLRQILAVKELYPKAILNFLIENGKITVSINTGKDMFEFFSITHSLLQDKFFEKFYDEINTIYKVKDLLNG